jgi:small subunit ribosomal protein S18
MARQTNPDRAKRTRSRTTEDFGMARKRARFLEGVKQIPLNDPEFLQKMMTDYGKILPVRLTGATAKQQRKIKHGIRRLRVLGMLP